MWCVGVCVFARTLGGYVGTGGVCVVMCGGVGMRTYSKLVIWVWCV